MGAINRNVTDLMPRVNVSHNDFLHLQSDKIATLNSRGLCYATHGKRMRTIESERFFNHRKGGVVAELPFKK